MGIDLIHFDAPVIPVPWAKCIVFSDYIMETGFQQNVVCELYHSINPVYSARMGVSQYLKVLSLLSVASAAPNYAVPGTLPKNAAPLDASPVGAS